MPPAGASVSGASVMAMHGRLLPQPPSRQCPAQAGAVTEADYESLVLKLHDIQVGGRAAAAGGGWRQASACSLQLIVCLRSGKPDAAAMPH